MDVANLHQQLHLVVEQHDAVNVVRRDFFVPRSSTTVESTAVPAERRAGTAGPLAAGTASASAATGRGILRGRAPGLFCQPGWRGTLRWCAGAQVESRESAGGGHVYLAVPRWALPFASSPRRSLSPAGREPDRPRASGDHAKPAFRPSPLYSRAEGAPRGPAVWESRMGARVRARVRRAVVKCVILVTYYLTPSRA